MTKEPGPILDMTPDGTFIEPPKPTIGLILLRIALFGLALCIVAALFWAALLLVPLLILLVAFAYFGARAGLFRSR